MDTRFRSHPKREVRQRLHRQPRWSDGELPNHGLAHADIEVARDDRDTGERELLRACLGDRAGSARRRHADRDRDSRRGRQPAELRVHLHRSRTIVAII